MPDQTLTPLEKDTRAQKILLHLLLEEHPASLTMTEICSRLEPLLGDTFERRDTFSRAARDLISYGLAHQVDGLTLASQAGARAFELLNH